MIRPIELTCCNLEFAKGVDRKKINFGWKNISDNGESNQYQTAYQIVVTDTFENVIFDSGKVMSRQQLNNYHTIDAIRSSAIYYYRVRVWDKDDKSSPLSEKTSFITGILNNSEWQAEFVNAAQVLDIDIMNDTVWYRKEFEVNDDIRSAICHIGCIGHFELYVNGKKVDNRVMSPSRSRILDYKRTLYLTYDLSDMLRKGSNVIGVWCDAGWARNAQIKPAFICHMEIDGENGKFVMTSDESWKCKKSGIRHIGKFEWADFGGEEICENEFDKVWSTAEITSEDWDNVSRTRIDTTLSAELLDGDGVVERFSPLSIEKRDHVIAIDMGKNYTGWVEIKLRGEKGTRLTIKVADKPSESVTFSQVSEYVFSASQGVFCNKFNYFSGRYITIEGNVENINPQDVTGLVLSNIMKKAADFKCSDTLLNDIYSTDLETYTATTLNGVTVDCPHRERLGYGETGISSIWGIGCHNVDSQAFYRNFFRNWRDTQFPDGYLPHVSPNFDGGGGTTWSSCLTIGLNDYYSYYGDRELLVENYESMILWAKYILDNVHDGILQRYDRDSADFSFLGDWATFEGDDWGNSENALFFNNCVAIYTLDITAKFSEILGEIEHARKLRDACRQMRTALHNKFFDFDKKTYIQGQQRYLSVALCADIVPKNEKSAVSKNLIDSFKQKNYLDGGSAGTIFILRAVGDILERHDLVYSWLKRRDCPSYGYFLENGQNTWPEMWDIRDIYGGSRIHTCYTGIAGWFTRYLLGIKPAGVGMKEVNLTPFFPEDMSFIEAFNDYGYGRIKISWQRSGGNLIKYTLTAPANTTINLFAPKGSMILSGSERISTISVGSGEYSFEFIR